MVLVDSMSPHLSNVDVSPQKEGTMGIHHRVSGVSISVISYLYIVYYLLLLACLLVTLGNFT
jgi:hypothetical protein